MRRLMVLKEACASAVVAVIGSLTLGSCSSAAPETHGDAFGTAGALVAVQPADDRETKAGVRAYRLLYLTSPASGTADGPIEASGLMLVPHTITSSALTSYQHGSAVARDDVPSVAGTPHREAADVLARSGRVVVAADYLGLGSSTGTHPWLDADTEAGATADLLKAVPAALSEIGQRVPTEVDLVGFSQGAHATMALARSYDSTAGPFAVRSIIGIAGPYRLDAVDVPALVHGGSDPTVRSLALARLVDTAGFLGHDIAGTFSKGWREKISGLFDGGHTDVDVVTSLPENPRELFTESGWVAVQDAGSPFGRWLATTSAVCEGWTTDVQVTLLHARGDTMALAENSELCRAQLQSAGVAVTLEDLGNLDHIPSGEAGRLRAAEILQNLDHTR